ncbi:MAG: hypothetical protein H5T86_10000 [Armatimonadetes bacterium]|nr:hypothetical protein [Armatimonadota bacterium]
MTLIARLVLAIVGAVYLPAVLAGRLLVAHGADWVTVLKWEALAGAVGLTVASAVIGLGRRRRSQPARSFSNVACLTLGAMVLAAALAPHVPFGEAIWRVLTWVWPLLAAVTVLAWFAARGAQA